jgi:hypothetical protein
VLTYSGSLTTVQSVTLTWFRAQRQLSAAALLLSLAALLAVPHAGASHHDAESSIIALSHDRAAQRIGRAAADVAPPDHCAVCHWTRAFRLLTESSAVATPSAATVILPVREVVGLTTAGIAAQPSPRGPPRTPIA